MHRRRVEAELLVHVFEAIPDQEDIGGSVRHVDPDGCLAEAIVLNLEHKTEVICQRCPRNRIKLW